MMLDTMTSKIIARNPKQQDALVKCVCGGTGHYIIVVFKQVVNGYVFTAFGILQMAYDRTEH
jgi:hypothetical protein